MRKQLYQTALGNCCGVGNYQNADCGLRKNTVSFSIGLIFGTLSVCLQCFDAVGCVAGRASGLWWGAGVVICLERRADLHTAQLMPLPLTVPCFSKIQIGFTIPVPAHPGSPGKGAVQFGTLSFATSGPSHAGVLEDGDQYDHDDDGTEQDAGNDTLDRLLGVDTRVIVADIGGSCAVAGGTCWSVLLVDRRDVRRVHHYDAGYTTAATALRSTCSQ